jgi:RNA polymerase sigma-70 factor (ECF subfamily)
MQRNQAIAGKTEQKGTETFDVALLRRCVASGDHDEWEVILRRLHRPISLAILRVSRQSTLVSPQIGEELVQETYLKLCRENWRALLDFANQHPDRVEGYVRLVAANVAYDHIRSVRCRKRGSEQPASSVDVDDLAVSACAWQGQHPAEKAVLLGQIDAVLAEEVRGSNHYRDRFIFWLYYHAGLSAKEIASVRRVNLSVKGVESTILRITRLIRQRLAGFPSDSHAPEAL